VAVVLREPADARCHHFFRCAGAMPADGEPRESQMIAVAELGVGKGQAKEGAQKLIVGEQGENSPEKELTPPVRFAGSGACLAAGARSLARFLRGRLQT
jgi:hypothetical protein